jgi:hypothetical protein
MGKLGKIIYGSLYQTFALIGNQLEDTDHDICGIVLSVRHSEDILSIWTSDATATKSNQQIK